MRPHRNTSIEHTSSLQVEVQTHQLCGVDFDTRSEGFIPLVKSVADRCQAQVPGQNVEPFVHQSVVAHALRETHIVTKTIKNTNAD